jgi:2-amino-4-hydroxy-6-hydroxymethyldihydropteridine diphosphokinase
MNTFMILLASNTNAAEHLAEAHERLKMLFPSDIRFSDMLESFSMNKHGVIDKKFTYLNALCQAFSKLPLESVLSLLKVMETEMGRQRGLEAKGMVAIDLDLVEWNGEILRPWDVAQPYYRDCLKSIQK